MCNVKQTFLSYLAKKNVSGSYLDPEQTIFRFDMEGIHFILCYDEGEDPYYIRIMIPLIDKIEKGTEEMLRRIIDFVMPYKTGKVYMPNGTDVWLVSEAFVYSSDNIDRLLDRIFAVLMGMLKDYRKEIIHGSEKSK